MKTMRNVIIHYHLFKNAGTAVDYILRQSFGDRLGFVEGTDGHLSPDDLGKFVQEHEDLVAVSSHQACLPLPQVMGVMFHPIVFLRDPIDRVGSVFSHYARTPVTDSDPNAIIAREQGLKAFVLPRPHNGVIMNCTVHYLLDYSRKEERESVNEADLESVMQRLKNLAIFGLVEEFDESMRRYKERLAPLFPELNIEYVHQGRSPDRATSLAERIARFRQEVGEDAFNLLNHGNAYDLKLYEFAKELFGSYAPDH
jgi:hypothetical protein